MISSIVNARSAAPTVWPSDHFQGLNVIVNVLPPFDDTGALTGLSESLTAGLEPSQVNHVGRHICHPKTKLL